MSQTIQAQQQTGFGFDVPPVVLLPGYLLTAHQASGFGFDSPPVPAPLIATPTQPVTRIVIASLVKSGYGLDGGPGTKYGIIPPAGSGGTGDGGSGGGGNQGGGIGGTATLIEGRKHVVINAPRSTVHTEES